MVCLCNSSICTHLQPIYREHIQALSHTYTQTLTEVAIQSLFHHSYCHVHHLVKLAPHASLLLVFQVGHRGHFQSKNYSKPHQVNSEILSSFINDFGQIYPKANDGILVFFLSIFSGTLYSDAISTSKKCLVANVVESQLL